MLHDNKTNGGAKDHQVPVGNDHAVSVLAPPTYLEGNIAGIMALHRKRVFHMEQRKRGDLTLGAFLRSTLGWRRDLPDAEAKTINARSGQFIKIGKAIVKQEMRSKSKPRPIKGSDDPQFIELRDFIVGTIRAAHYHLDAEEMCAEKMDEQARLLPVADWFLKNVFRKSALQLAVIVGDIGDLARWPDGKETTLPQIWKRMGLAPFEKDGEMRAGSVWRKAGGLSKKEWEDFGYSPVRRSRMYVIGDVLIKQNGYYRDVYVARKKVEREKAKARGLTVAPAARIPKGREAEFISDGHVHKLAQRYMEKRLLKHLWRAWREARACVSEKTIKRMPLSAYSNAARAA
jgi:hypothetical protein